MKEKRKYADRKEYIKNAVSKRRKKIREMAKEYKGGKCSICGYSKCDDALEFHHKSGKKKEFGLSQVGLTRNWERVKKEVDKCILVCVNCHRELHSKKRSLRRRRRSEK